MKGQQNINILIIDDDEDDFMITSEYIRSIPGNTYQIHWAGTYKKGMEHLLANDHDLYFADYRLGAKSGVDFLKEAQAAGSEAPIVLLTGQGNYEVDIEAMKWGAVDYLIKAELNTEKMERCIRYAMDRTQNLKALKRSESKFRSIFEKSKDIIFVADEQLRITDVNAAMHDMLGIAKGKGLLLTDLFCYVEDKQMISDAISKGSELNDFPTSLWTRNGKKLQCTITLSVERSDNNTDYVQGIIHDITSLKKAEIAALQTEKLAATGRLVRTLAHEVRNPLNNIAMSAEYLNDENNSEDERLYLDIIKRNSNRINNLISELLQSSIPRDNTLKPHTLQLITNEVIAASADRVTLKKMKANISYHEQPATIHADFENLKLALLNIVINAIEAMEENNGILTVSIDIEEKNAILKITDNGCGISEENIGRIFEPYYTRKRNGSGLGLPFTLNILKAHKAAIEVTSTPGKGSNFTIAFPLTDAAEVDTI